MRKITTTFGALLLLTSALTPAIAHAETVHEDPDIKTYPTPYGHSRTGVTGYITTDRIKTGQELSTEELYEMGKNLIDPEHDPSEYTGSTTASKDDPDSCHNIVLNHKPIGEPAKCTLTINLKNQGSYEQVIYMYQLPKKPSELKLSVPETVNIPPGFLPDPYMFLDESQSNFEDFGLLTEKTAESGLGNDTAYTAHSKRIKSNLPSSPEEVTADSGPYEVEYEIRLPWGQTGRYKTKVVVDKDMTIGEYEAQNWPLVKENIPGKIYNSYGEDNAPGFLFGDRLFMVYFIQTDQRSKILSQVDYDKSSLIYFKQDKNGSHFGFKAQFKDGSSYFYENSYPISAPADCPRYIDCPFPHYGSFPYRLLPSQSEATGKLADQPELIEILKKNSRLPDKYQYGDGAEEKEWTLESITYYINNYLNAAPVKWEIKDITYAIHKQGKDERNFSIARMGREYGEDGNNGYIVLPVARQEGVSETINITTKPNVPVTSENEPYLDAGLTFAPQDKQEIPVSETIWHFIDKYFDYPQEHKDKLGKISVHNDSNVTFIFTDGSTSTRPWSIVVTPEPPDFDLITPTAPEMTDKEYKNKTGNISDNITDFLNITETLKEKITKIELISADKDGDPRNVVTRITIGNKSKDYTTTVKIIGNESATTGSYPKTKRVPRSLYNSHLFDEADKEVQDKGGSVTHEAEKTDKGYKVTHRINIPNSEPRVEVTIVEIVDTIKPILLTMTQKEYDTGSHRIQEKEKDGFTLTGGNLTLISKALNIPENEVPRISRIIPHVSAGGYRFDVEFKNGETQNVDVPVTIVDETGDFDSITPEFPEMTDKEYKDKTGNISDNITDFLNIPETLKNKIAKIELVSADKDGSTRNVVIRITLDNKKTKDYTVTVKTKDDTKDKTGASDNPNKNNNNTEVKQNNSALASTGSIAGVSALVASILSGVGIGLTRRKKEL